MTTTTQLTSHTLRRASELVFPGAVLLPGAMDHEQSSAGERTICISTSPNAPARGIEISIEGLSIDDVYRAYYLSRYGAPKIEAFEGGIVAKFESLWGSQIREVHQRCASQPDMRATHRWDILLYGAGSSERCALEISTMSIKATYHWLRERDSTAGVAATPAYVWVPRQG